MWFLGDVKVAKSKYLNSADGSIEDSPLVPSMQHHEYGHHPVLGTQDILFSSGR